MGSPLEQTKKFIDVGLIFIDVYLTLIHIRQKKFITLNIEINLRFFKESRGD